MAGVATGSVPCGRDDCGKAVEWSAELAIAAASLFSQSPPHVSGVTWIPMSAVAFPFCHSDAEEGTKRTDGDESESGTVAM